MELENQYPIGKFQSRDFSEAAKLEALESLKALPAAVEAALLNLDESQLHTPYRDGGWTVLEVVHHLADANMSAYIRNKLALTEDNPRIAPFDENKWTELNDVKDLPAEISATLLHALHLRWYAALKDLSDADWERTVYHPAMDKNITLWYYLQFYAWHGRHHVAQINYLREKRKW